MSEQTGDPQTAVPRRLLARIVAAWQLPDVCPHDSEPDICDGCRYAMEKAMQALVTEARQALADAERAPEPPADPQEGTA